MASEQYVSVGHLTLLVSRASGESPAAARDLKSYGVAVVTISPGFTRTEAMLAAFADDPLPSGSQSVELSGRGVR